MGTKKIIKLLMAEGVQRNDAAAFVRAYQKLKFKSVIRQFPELIVPPPMPIRTQTIYPKQYAAEFVLSKQEIRSGSFDYERYVRHKLSEKLARGLEYSGFILFEHKEYAEDVVFTAKLRVLSPDGLEVHTLRGWG